MKTIYFTLQGKGGVGKTLGSSYLQQYLENKSDKKSKIMGIDTDPNNTSFTSIRKLNVKFLPLFDEEQKINERNFDKMIELFYNNTDTTFIVDNGATSFLPLISYLVDNNIMEMLEDKFNIIIHIPITGGQAQDDTLNGMSYIIDTFKSHKKVKFNIWINEYFGKVTTNKAKHFEEFDLYNKYKEHINGLLYLEQVNEKTYGVDLEKMHKGKLTFDEIALDTNFTLMEKQRLSSYKKKIFEMMDKVIEKA